MNIRVAAATAMAALVAMPVPAMGQSAEQPSMLDAGLKKSRNPVVTELAEQGRGRRRTRRSLSGSRRSWGRTLTGLTLVVGGVITARTSNTRNRGIADRNAVRGTWNDAAATTEELLLDYDRRCAGRSYLSEYCFEILHDGLPAQWSTLLILSTQHDFLPQPPDVGSFVTDQEEERFIEWSSTGVDLESKRLWTGMFYGGLAAAGVGALLATVWADTPVLRDLRVQPGRNSMAVATSLAW